MMSKLFMASLSLLLALGCAYTARQGDNTESRSHEGGGGGTTMTSPSDAPRGEEVLDVRIVEKGSQSLITQDTELAFTDGVKFENWYESHSHDRKTPVIDFDKQMAVAVVLPRNTGGFAINLERAIAAGQQVRIVYSELRPSTDMIVIQALTQPYFIAVMPKRPGKVVFERRIKVNK